MLSRFQAYVSPITDWGFFSSGAYLQIVPRWKNFEQIQAVERNCDLYYFRESICLIGVEMFCCAVTHLAVVGGKFFEIHLFSLSVTPRWRWCS